MKAILGRITRSQSSDVFQCEEGVIDFSDREFLRSGKPMELTSKEFDLLA